jgi:hypothetical protein
MILPLRRCLRHSNHSIARTTFCRDIAAGIDDNDGLTAALLLLHPPYARALDDNDSRRGTAQGRANHHYVASATIATQSRRSAKHPG